MNTGATVFLIVILAIAFILVLLLAMWTKLQVFWQELDYINTEIERASKAGKKYWKKKRRKLWWSLLLFRP